MTGRSVGITNRSTQVSGRTVGRSDDILDNENLHSHWDATELSGVSTFTDQQGNNDLSAVGDPTLESDGINGNQTVLYDGVDDLHETASWDTTLDVPNTVYAVYEFASIDDTTREEFFGGRNPDSEASHWFRASDSGDWDFFTGNSISGGTTDTNPHVAVTVSGESGIIEIDDTGIASGDAGSRSIASGKGFWLGGIGPAARYSNVRVGEVAVYDARHGSSTRTEFYNYAANKWGL